jgi:HEAT repeat protein
MAFTYEQVVAILSPDEPTQASVQTLDESAIPHLERMIASDNESLAVKAAFALAHTQSDKTPQILRTLVAHPKPVMRVAAASAASRLPLAEREEILTTLLDDPDLGVQKATLRSVGTNVSANLKERIESRQWANEALQQFAVEAIAQARVDL